MELGDDSDHERLRTGIPAVLNDSLTLPQDAEAAERAQAQSCQTQPPVSHIPGHEILRCLGEGAYGSVWLAREKNTGKHVSIKFYTHHRGLDWSLLNREVEKLAVLYTSRNIVGLLDVGWDHNPPYYVMEYLENGSLAALLTQGRLPPQEAVRIAKSILQALVHAHGSGILHCDLKPANVLLDADFEPRLCDFGQSRLSTEQDPALGTLFYMAPEQADLNAIPDARWDVYALGALLYHLLCGQPPFRTEENEQRIRSVNTLEGRLAVYRRIVSDSPPPRQHRELHGVDKRLAEIVERCLKVNPERRFPNAQAVLDTLDLRDRQLSRKPLIALGVVGPILLLVALLPVARYAMHQAVQTARDSLTQRALESDVLSVNILATLLERDLEYRKTDLVDIARDKAVREALQAATASKWKDRTELYRILDQHYKDATDKRKRHGSWLENSWFLCDAQGNQRWRSEISAKTIDKNWAHRDYFHGLNQQFAEDEEPDEIQPLAEPHVSLAYRGTSQEKYKVAISVPVMNTDDKSVIGVLARTSELGQLLAEYESRITYQERKDVNRLIVLVDHRDGKLLDHPWIRKVHESGLPDQAETFERLTMTDVIKSKLSRLHQIVPTASVAAGGDDRDASFLDPVAKFEPETYGQEWLAAFCPVRGTSWSAVVQEPKNQALRPVEKLQRELNGYFWLALSLFCGLISALWFFVLRAINDRTTRSWSKSNNTRSFSGISTVSDR